MKSARQIVEKHGSAGLGAAATVAAMYRIGYTWSQLEPIVLEIEKWAAAPVDMDTPMFPDREDFPGGAQEPEPDHDELRWHDDGGAL